jgi:hypothetical protein
MKLVDRSKGTLAVLLGAAALALVAPSCGGDDDDTTATGGKGGAGGKAGTGGTASGTGGSKSGTGGATGGNKSGNTGGAVGTGGASTGGTGGAEETGGTATGGKGGGTGGKDGGTGGTATGGTKADAGAGGTGAEGGAEGGMGPEGGTGQGGSVNPPEGGSAGESTGGAPQGGEAGAGGGPSCPAAARTNVATFDGGVISGWAVQVSKNVLAPGTPDPTLVMSGSTTEGHDGAGAVKTVITWTGYGSSTAQYSGQQIQLYHYDSLNWTCKTKMHGWMKVTMPGGPDSEDYATIFGWQLTVNSGPSYSFKSSFSKYTDEQWHEFVVDLTDTDNVHLDDIRVLGDFISTMDTQPSGAPAVPPETTIYYDDLWIE